MHTSMYLPDAQQALGFLVSQVTHIEAQVYEIEYADIQYPSLVPVDTSAAEWAKDVTYFSMDKVGQAKWLNHLSNDIPLADIERTKFVQPVEMSGIGYRWTLEELGQAMMVPNVNLTADRAAAARRASEEFIDAVAITGNTEKSFTGLLNDPNITASSAPNGGGGTPEWPTKTPDEIIADINNTLTGVYSGTLQVEIADTLLLGVDRFTLLSTTRLTDTSESVLDYIMRKNVYTAVTGQPLMVRVARGLETAGAGSSQRMMVYRRAPDVLKMHIPMPHRFLPVWQTGPLVFDVPGIFRFGGLEIRLPRAARYLDDI